MKKSDKVTIADLDTAYAWLICNEGSGGESEACHRVARLIATLADQREEAARKRATQREINN